MAVAPRLLTQRKLMLGWCCCAAAPCPPCSLLLPAFTRCLPASLPFCMPSYLPDCDTHGQVFSCME